MSPFYRRSVTAVATVTLAVRVGVAQDATGRVVQSRIDRVAVYADRAEVHRSAPVSLSEETAAFVFARLPGWIDEASVRVSLVPPAAGRITDVRVDREYLARAGDADMETSERQAREVADQVAELQDEERVLAERQKQIEGIRAFSIEKLPKDAATREVRVQEYGEVVEYVTGALRDLAKARRAIERKRREIDPELAAREKRKQELRQRTQLEQCTIRVVLEAGKAGQARIGLSYLLPGATWEPAHDLRTRSPTSDEVTMVSYAVVTQSTGEDWQDVEIAFSTQSSQESTRIPELDALLLGGGQSFAQLSGGVTPSFQAAQTKYDDQNRLWFNYVNPQLDVQSFANNVEQQKSVQHRTQSAFRRLRQRGTSAHFTGIGRPTIRSDGRSTRVPIGERTLAGVRRIVAAPEVSLNAANTVEMSNTGDQPLLPGRIALYQEGSFLGVTDIDFVAQGEPFAVFLGVADQIKLARTLDRKRSLFVPGKRNRMQTCFDVSVENLADRSAAVRLADRTPVSSVKDIEVRRVQIEPETKPDADGLLKWDFQIAAREKRTFRIEYTIEYPADLVSRVQAGKPAAEMPASSAIVEQIRDLEVLHR